MLKVMGFKAGKAKKASLNSRQKYDWIWVDIFSPTEEEKRRIMKDFGISFEHIEDIMDFEEIPRMEKAKGYSILFLRVPAGNDASTIAAVMGKDFLVTFHREKSRTAKRAFTSAGKFSLNSPRDGLYHLIEASIDAFDDLAEELEKDVYRLEEKVLKGEAGKGEEIFELRERIGSMYRALLLNRRALKSIRDPAFSDLGYEILSVMEKYAELKDSVVNLISLHMSMQDVKMQEIMKFLAGITVIAAIAEVISGIYGMNFKHIPLSAHPFGFIIVVAVTLLLMVLAYIYFSMRGWL